FPTRRSSDLMSVRNFDRVFTRELGKTPSHYVLQMRAEAARRQLESADQGLKQIAVACGFGSTDSMRRAFWRSVGTTPHKYRRQLYSPRNRVSSSSGRWPEQVSQSAGSCRAACARSL